MHKPNLLLTTFIFTICFFVFISPCFSASSFADAMDQYQQKRYHAAVPLFEQAIQQEPNNALAYYYLGATFEQLKDRDNAKKMYEACFKINPFSTEGRQARDALNNLISTQAAITHPYDEPNVVDTSVRTINQEVNHLQQNKINLANVEANYQLDRGNYRAYRLGLRANSAYNNYFNPGAGEISNMALIRSYGALAYAQRSSNQILTNGYQAARYARESGNNLINSFNVQPSKPDEPQLRAQGTNLYIRNYTYTDNDDVAPPDPIIQLKATAGRLSDHATSNKIGQTNSGQ